MARTVTVTGVANEEVASVVSGYEHEGATVTVTAEPSGNTSTIVAVWPDSSAANGVSDAADVAVQLHAAAAVAHSAAAAAHASAATALAAVVGQIPTGQ